MHVTPRPEAHRRQASLARVAITLAMTAWCGWDGLASAAGGDMATSLPHGIVFLGGDCSLHPQKKQGTSLDSLSVTVFTPRHSRAFPEYDLPCPVKVGRRLYVVEPASSNATPRVLLDAGQGAIGSPSVSFDGKSVYFSMVKPGEHFYHLYRIDATDKAAKPEPLTRGYFHDIDPAELPDGRIVFVSTRIGTFEEYHNTPARSLFIMNADGSDIRPLTQTIIFDNEPEVMADGRLLCLRSDNFFDRGKVETLLHALRPDGTQGETAFGLEHGPSYGNRLRHFTCGSPAPMPDGRVAFASGVGLTIGRPGDAPDTWRQMPMAIADVAAVPDGRLLVTLSRKGAYSQIHLVDPDTAVSLPVVTMPEAGGLHSPVALGPRPRPPILPGIPQHAAEDTPDATGVLYCQDVRSTLNTTAGWPHVRAVRVLAGKGLTTRSSHSYIVHAGSDVTELGTVPLASDGSFAVEIPANTAIAFQAVDAEGRSELNEMSWLYVKPGEVRGCVGCHQPRGSTPHHADGFMQAMRARPVKLTGSDRSFRFRGNNAAVTGLTELQFDRFREVAGINRHTTADGAPAVSRAACLEALETDLTSAMPATVIAAAQRLAIFRDRSAAAALTAQLAHPDREVRIAVAMALATCGTRESVQPLVSTLDDGDPIVARAAAVALENHTGHDDPSIGVESMSGKERMARWRQWLDATPWEEIEKGLIDRLDGDLDEVRQAAVALGHIGGDAAKIALRSRVERDRHRNPYPEWRKSHRGDNTRFDALSEANPRTLQAVVRALGALRDHEAVPLLEETLLANVDPVNGNLFLAEAVIDALGHIATPRTESILVATLFTLQPYHLYCRWYGDHDALIACHASPLHARVIEALDATEHPLPNQAVPALIQMLPTDPDRALLLTPDDFEVLVGRLVRRAEGEPRVVNTCLSVLGDREAEADGEIHKALGQVPSAWAGTPDSVIRAAQVLSVVAADARYEPRIRAALDRYAATETDIPRVFDTGIPIVTALPTKNWVCFYLARALGGIGDSRSVPALLEALARPSEATRGRPDPLGPGVAFLHDDLTPCWRAATASALGKIGDRRALPALVAAVDDLDNAPDTRHAAAEAVGRMATSHDLGMIRALHARELTWSLRKTLLRGMPVDRGPSSH
jgi:HEAT repeat protein